ncbi:MAG: DUF3857 and transglutaminase domain-containing protein [Candidatus Omnitrophica bacterium]|nr:DUF3857 and transglutaminase domain-containing protein [Candidatus Omnitrophota bacterium]MBU1924042.1 DUF3857 and transglutaminase domain-containing protein [Candidatus Omnitrophota bacterium]
MKKLIALIGIISLCLGLAFAEEKIQSFEEKHQDKDFIFLEDRETIKVNEDWSYRKEEYRKLEILKEEARSMGEIPIWYDKEKDRIIEFSAYTTTPDGKKHKYTKTNDVSLYESYPIYSNAMVKMVTMPEVNVGSVIEYKVVIESKGSQIKNAFWKVIYFTPNNPTKLFKTAIILPKKLNIKYKEFNLTYKPKITQNHATITYSWEIPDVYDERKDEDYVPPPQLKDIPEVVEFSSIKSWKDMSNWYYDLVQKNIKITPDIKAAAQKAITGKLILKDKVRAILEYIQDNFRYVSMSLGEYSFKPHSTDQVFKNKYGDCKDLALLCVAMFKVAGTESNVALFMDEFSITDPQYDLPIPTLFNHVVVRIKDEAGKNFYVDPQLKGYDIGEYPFPYQNAYTFIITQDGGEFGRLPIFAEGRGYTRKDENIVINADGSALTEITSLWPLSTSIDLREKIKSLNNTQKEDFFKDLNAMLADGGEVLERRWGNFDNRYGRIKSYVKIKQRAAYIVSDGMIIIDVSGYRRNIELTKEKRENPIFFPVNDCDEETAIYQIPKGFRALSIPSNIDKDIGFLSLKREYKRDKDKVIIREVVKHKRIETPKEQYPKVKEFFDKLSSQTQQRIVLKKSKSWQQKLKEIWDIIRQ